MFRIILIWLIPLSFHQFNWIAAVQMELCPTMCICDIHQNLNTANCSNEHLISAFIGISSYVEYLDLSSNDIMIIDNYSFQELDRLKTLLLNRNSISFIELDAFSRLTQLKSINLANNRLESFDNRIFEENMQLIDIDLSHNKFMLLSNEPILKSKSLQTLNLHKSFLTHLHVKYFEDLPNVRTIDLSGNLLIVLNMVAFAVNNQLRELNINGNRMKCDAQMEMSIIWLKRNNVQVFEDICSATIAPTKFERIQAFPINVTESIPASIQSMRSPTNLSSVWRKTMKYIDKVPVLGEKCIKMERNTNACHLFEMCASNLTHLLMEVEEKLTKPPSSSSSSIKTNYNLLNLHHTWSEFITVHIAFYGGLFLGAMLGAIVLFTMKLISDCIEMSGSRKVMGCRERRNRPYTTEIRHNGNNIDATQENFNRNQLVSRINRTNNDVDVDDAPAIEQITRRQRSSTSIFAIFYERPVRRRYYRQFNRNATNLVRRLSQSRLFLNSSRALNRNNRSHHRDNQENILSTIELNQEENIENESNEHEVMLSPPLPLLPSSSSSNSLSTIQNDCISVHSLNIIHDNRNNDEMENRFNRRTFTSEQNLTIAQQQLERCETPPPPYNVVVK